LLRTAIILADRCQKRGLSVADAQIGRKEGKIDVAWAEQLALQQFVCANGFIFLFAAPCLSQGGAGERCIESMGF
jgi:hypothetical protein